MLDLLCWNLLFWNGWWLFPSSDMIFTSSLNKLKQIPKSWYKQPSFQVQVSQVIFQDTKIEDIPPIILQANFYLILGLAPQQKPNQIEDIL